MKKWRFVLLSMIIVVMMSGCSHKSNAELVDVEQFRCQDSIETVFEVLGESELKEYSYPSYLENGDMAYYERGYYIIFADIKDASYYLYEKVNLFGFNGYVVFDVRDDKETIQGIYCNLTLNDEEFNELVEYFEKKYGSYKVDNFGETIKTYEWIISEKNGKVGYGADEIGYDEIVIENRGDDKYIVAFNDEWSFENDKYYQALEESKKTQIETSEVLVEKEYDICGDDVRLLIVSKDEEYEFMCYGTARNKSNANILTMMLYTICEKMKEESYEYSIMVSYDNGGCIVLAWDGDSYITAGINEDGSATFSKPDWFEGEDTMSESELNEYAEVLTNAFKDTVSELQE